MLFRSITHLHLEIVNQNSQMVGSTVKSRVSEGKNFYYT